MKLKTRMFTAPHLTRTRLILLLGLAIFLVVYWLIPIPGQVLLVSDNWLQENAWPQTRIDTRDLQPGTTASLTVFDTVPWAHVKLIIAEQEGVLGAHVAHDTTGVYQWNWSFTVPDMPGYDLKFYHDCDTGCQMWTTVTVAEPSQSDGRIQVPDSIPTKLGVVFANPERDWHNRRGWDIELTYAQMAEADYWGIDDLATRVQTATDKGLRVLVRIDYAQGQSIPPRDDYLALDTYLNYIRRLARDDRLESVYGYVIGSSFNTEGSNALSPQNKVTPAWYARVFNGYGTPLSHTDNVVQIIRTENPAAGRILVGAVAPWRTDQNGELVYQINVPWLNYFNTMLAAIDLTAQQKAAAGIPLAAPDGFSIQASGRPDSPELTNDERAREPHLNLHRSEWSTAQAGFRVYQDWLDVINAYPYTKGLPVYITATNTFQSDTGTAPAENYPPGWLTSALDVINQEPQVLALCWFLDSFPHDDQWDLFSLTDPHGLVVNASDEFDTLLQRNTP